jgi:hypothetical protein
MDSASQNPFQKKVYESHVINLLMYMELLFHYQGHLSNLADRTVALANELEEYKIIIDSRYRRKNRGHEYL